MNLRRKDTTMDTATTAADPLVDRHDEAKLAQQYNEQAAKLRGGLAEQLAAAEAKAAKAREQAAAWVAEVEKELAEVQSRVRGVEWEASVLSEKGGHYGGAARFAEQIKQVEEQVHTLAKERETCLARAEEFAGQLAKHEQAIRDAETALDQARTAMDADAAGKARTRLTGLQELTPGLTRQRDAARERAAAIGTEDSGGEVTKLRQRIAALAKQRSDILDHVEPARVKARIEADPWGSLSPQQQTEWLVNLAAKTEKVRPIINASGKTVGHVRQP